MTQERKFEYYRDLSKRVTPSRYRCQCSDGDHDQCDGNNDTYQHASSASPHGKTSTVTSYRDTPEIASSEGRHYEGDDDGLFDGLASIRLDKPLVREPGAGVAVEPLDKQHIHEEYTSEGRHYEGEDEDGLFGGLEKVEASIRLDKPLVREPGAGVAVEPIAKQHIPDDYTIHCDTCISFTDVNKAFQHFQSSDDRLVPGDEKCLRFCYTLIKKIADRGGPQIWKDAKLSMYGRNISLIMKSGAETNQFEIVLDEKENPIDHCPQRGLRLQFWDGLPIVISTTKAVMPLVAKLIPGRLITGPVQKMIESWMSK